MPLTVQCDNLPLSKSDAQKLWTKTIELQEYPDETVTVKCVSIEEITALNSQYRSKEKPTNILTFSYGEGEHDIALCLQVARKEAEDRLVTLRDYVALLLVHAFLHATGLDHEVSAEEEKKMQLTEKKILEETGFAVNNL